MNHCKIVEDLLPLFVDELTNEESTEYVRQHLVKCPTCAQAYRQMKSPVLAENEVEFPDYKKPLRRNILSIVLQTVGVCVLSIVLCLYLMWETGFLFASEKTMEAADGSNRFVVRYYDEAGFFNRCGAYIITPDGRGRNYRGNDTFVDAYAYWAPNNEYYFVHYEFTDHDETFYWGYDAAPTSEIDENGNIIGYHSNYWDRAYPKDEDFYGYLEELCRSHTDLAPNWDKIEFDFVQWSDDSYSMCFSFSTDDGQSGLIWYSILTNTIDQIIQ